MIWFGEPGCSHGHFGQVLSPRNEGFPFLKTSLEVAPYPGKSRASENEVPRSLKGWATDTGTPPFNLEAGWATPEGREDQIQRLRLPPQKACI